MLVAVELQILSNEFIYDEVFVGQVGSAGRGVIKSAKDLGSDFGPDLGQNSSLFECLFENFLELVDRSHLKTNNLKI